MMTLDTVREMHRKAFNARRAAKQANAERIEALFNLPSPWGANAERKTNAAQAAYRASAS